VIIAKIFENSAFRDKFKAGCLDLGLYDIRVDPMQPLRVVAFSLDPAPTLTRIQPGTGVQ
jgi:hypothetical protein